MSTEADGRRRKEEHMEYAILVSIPCALSAIGIIYNAWWLRELVKEQADLRQQLKELKRQLL